MILDPKEMESRATLFLRGEYQPNNNTERLELISFCWGPGYYLALARLFAAAFAADPKLADDLNSWHRYNAACAAVRTGSGQAKDAKDLEDKERARGANRGESGLAPI